MARYLLDTTVLIDVLRGKGAADRIRALRATSEPPYICAINAEEIIRGVKPRERATVDLLLQGCRIVLLGREEGVRAGEWRRAYAERGVTLSQADCLIAAAAASVDAVLATGNPKDFPMDEVIVEHWPVGR